MPRDHHYLADIVEAEGHIANFLAGVEKEAFLTSELLKSATLQKLTVIGEAANRLTPELKAAHPAVPWRNVVAFRNIAVHAYFAVDWEIAWEAATLHAPAFAKQMQVILETQNKK
jgi:uncharacterized protein with HEPN domain